MTENSITPSVAPLAIVVKETKKKSRAKLISLKPLPSVRKVLLPPQQDGYIKAKKHDFL